METTRESDRAILAVIAAFSAFVLGYLFWLLYFRAPGGGAPGWTASLPAVNAFLNGSSAVLLFSGWRAIRGGHQRRHRNLMVSALVVSALFLTSYVLYHHFHGDTVFTGQGPIRRVYFFILISHILLSIVGLPMVLTTVFFAATRRFTRHRRLARLTLPLWLYVSTTGVLVFLFLKFLNPGR